MPLVSVNPATGETLQTHEEHTAEEIRARLEAAVDGFKEWRDRPLRERAGIISLVSADLDRDADAHAHQITREMGKPLREAKAEVQKCARALRWCADHAEEALEPRSVSERMDVRYEPLGPVLGIMPWNFPYWQAIRFAGPALMAGNVVLLKHARNVSGCLTSLESAFREAGGGKAFHALHIGSKRIAATIRNKRVRAVSLTGSEDAGKSVARAAGGARKPCVLELGGSDPFVVFEDADVAQAAKEAAKARCINSGQSCIAAKRFLIDQDVYDDFLGQFTQAMENLIVGDPTAGETDIGPLAREDLRETVDRQVRESVEAGAKVRLGGEPLEGDGYYYPPTVLTDVPANAPVLTEEVFGPVAPVVPFESEDEAVWLANATRYGLGASVWTRSRKRAERVTRRIEAGVVFTNATVHSDPKAPFGGVKASGYGRELGTEGFRAFTNIKTTLKRRLPEEEPEEEEDDEANP